jgi:Ca-activated chloride channel family protein
MPFASIFPDRRLLPTAVVSVAVAMTTLAAAGPTAQSRTGPGTFRSGTELVALPVTVVDPRGRYVSNLLQADFAVYEEGAEQSVALFAATHVPIDLMLLLDTSGSMQVRMDAAQSAAVEFVRALKPDDRAAVVLFGNGVRIAESLTGDRARLEQAISDAQASGGTALYEALYISLRELRRLHIESEPRRQVLVLLSDGDDTTSRSVELKDVLDEARRSPVTVFAIVPAESAVPGALLQSASRRRSAEYGLRLLAEETGGRSFVTARERDLSTAYRQIAEELGQQYWLAYAPAPGRPGFRRVSVRIATQPALRARTRSGYYADQRRDAARAASSVLER